MARNIQNLFSSKEKWGKIMIGRFFGERNRWYMIIKLKSWASYNIQYQYHYYS